MNFLAHHVVARERVGVAEAAAFYVGNVLPDLVSTSGVGRVRPVIEPTADPLLRGIALHLGTDRKFHGLEAFAAARSYAKELLLEVPFAVLPRRTFFLVHAAVEIALDGYLIRVDNALADDFYARFDAADLDDILAQTAALLAHDVPRPALVRTIGHFVEHRYLYRYAGVDGQAEALTRLCRRIGIDDFAADGVDRELLGAYFADLHGVVSQFADRLLLREGDGAPMVE